MAAQILSTELNTLAQESKRKNPDLRAAAEKSLQDLKSFHATSDAQLAADLIRRPYFINPFVVACGTRNPKYAGPAAVCFQRLIVIRALPKERLNEVLDSFKECSTLNLDIQLKILQALPSLLQNYSRQLTGDLQSTTLQVCSTLQNAKNPSVSNTAAATLQQLVSSIFDKVASEDDHESEIPVVSEISVEEGSIGVRPAALDAYEVFHDLCMLIDGSKTPSGKFPHLSITSAIELVETVFANHGHVVSNHPELAHVVRSVLMPFVIRTLPEKQSFPIVVRIARVTSILLRQHLSLIRSEGEIALGLLNNLLEPEAAPPWKRALCMEIWRSVYTEPGLLLKIYSFYDAAETSKKVMLDSINSFVRLSTERPSLIGLGSTSTAPMSQSRDSTAEQAALEAGGVAGVISGAVSSGASKTGLHGLSATWSTMRTACIDQLDKIEPPPVPETYVHHIILSCINGLAENLARFILPLTVHPESRRKRAKGADPGAEADSQSESQASSIARTQSFRKRTVPVNPLSLTKNSSYTAIQTAARLIDDCWPAILAICSTYMHAALDSDYYRSLIRAFQKFTQVAGLLRLSTARDALLTTLGKSAVPSGLTTFGLKSYSSSEAQGFLGNTKALLNVESLINQTVGDKTRRTSSTLEDNVTMGTRNLLCLRALLNLAIALGPTLEDTWAIIFETLQRADMSMSFQSAKTSKEAWAHGGVGSRADSEGSTHSLGSEIGAVVAATKRLLESTTDFPNESFIDVLSSLCRLLRTRPQHSTPRIGISTPPLTHHRQKSGLPVLPASKDAEEQASQFVLEKLGELVLLNLPRMIQHPSSESGWDLLVSELTAAATNAGVSIHMRVSAAEILKAVVRESASASLGLETDLRDQVQARSLLALQTEIKSLYAAPGGERESDIEIHAVALEALQAVLERCGETLTAGWQSVILVLLSVFETIELAPVDLNLNLTATSKEDDASSNAGVKVVSTKLGRLAFESVQLICSDFLSAIPDSTVLPLVDILYRFCSQSGDLNISLSTITFFWNVSDFLWRRVDDASLRQLARYEKEDALDFRDVFKPSDEQSIAALWLWSLLRLTAVSTDTRPDVRHGAVHTIHRIFETYGDQLSPESWTLCIRAVIYRLVALNVQKQTQLAKDKSSTTSEQFLQWNETSEIVLGRLGVLYANNLGTIAKSQQFNDLWHSMLQYLKLYLALNSHQISAATFSAITKILTKVDEVGQIGSPAMAAMAQLWSSHFPTSDGSLPAAQNSQDALVAYIKCLKEVYRLSQETITAAAIEQIAMNLRRSVRESDAPTYTSDVDHLTPLQTQVMDMLGALRTDIHGVPATMINLLSDYVILPFMASKRRLGKNLTYVALSKAAMPLLESIALKHIRDQDLYQSQNGLAAAFRALAVPVGRKYVAQRSSRSPPAWQIATSTALSIAGPALSTLQSLDQTSTSHATSNLIWDALVTLITHVVHAPVLTAPQSSNLFADESFDLAAFSQLRELLVDGLGQSHIHDSIRRRYAAALFSASLIQSPALGDLVPGSLPVEAASLADRPTESSSNLLHDDGGSSLWSDAELPSRDPTASPLENLFNIRRGRTIDDPAVTRERIAYACLEELMALVDARTAFRQPCDPDFSSRNLHHASRQIRRPLVPSPRNSSSSSTDDDDTNNKKNDEKDDGESTNREDLIRLARASAPYLIARAALSLKRYIADQPLRGALPQPTYQRNELLFILRRLRRLNADPRAIPDATGVQGKRKKHLHRLFPLVAKAVGVAGMGPNNKRGAADAEILEELAGWVEDVGSGFGVG